MAWPTETIPGQLKPSRKELISHILSDQPVPSCPDQLEYVEIGGGLGGFSWPGMENHENPYKTVENHTKV